jgi:hypothetical protein
MEKTSLYKQIRDYTGLNFKEISQLSYHDFLTFKRDSWIYAQKQSEQGRKLLEDLNDLYQTEPSQETLERWC